MNQQLLDYIKQAQENGTTDEQIKESLKGSGWSESDISEAFKGLAEILSPAGKAASFGVSNLISKKLLIILVAAVVAGSGVYYLLTKEPSSQLQIKPPTEQLPEEVFEEKTVSKNKCDLSKIDSDLEAYPNSVLINEGQINLGSVNGVPLIQRHMTCHALGIAPQQFNDFFVSQLKSKGWLVSSQRQKDDEGILKLLGETFDISARKGGEEIKISITSAGYNVSKKPK